MLHQLLVMDNCFKLFLVYLGPRKLKPHKNVDIGTRRWEGGGHLRVLMSQSVNDVAKRGVKLIQEYHDKLTKSEADRRYIIQVFSD